MKNKILIRLSIPEIDEIYDMYIPINKKIGSVVLLISKAVNELCNGSYYCKETYSLCNRETGEKYSPGVTVRQTNIRNGTALILI